MSKGNPIVKLRLSPETIRRIDSAIKNREHIQRCDTNTISEWIRGAIDERLAKLERGRARPGRKRNEKTGEPDERQADPENPQDPLIQKEVQSE